MPELGSPDERARLKEVLADPALGRILEALRLKWVRFGRAAGQVQIGSAEEAFALSGLLPRRVRAGGRLGAREIEDALLHHTRFGCTLREALEVHFGEPLVARSDRAAERAAAWEGAAADLWAMVEAVDLPEGRRRAMHDWMHAEVGRLRQRWARSADQLERDFRVLLGAAVHLPRDTETVALAVLANQAGDTPHDLDAGTSAASLFDRLLARLHPEVEDPFTRGAEGRDQLLAAAGIAKDRTSPKVDTFGLRPGDETLASLLCLPTLTLTLRTAEALRGGRLRCAGGVVHVVENPPVFDQLVDRMVGLHPELRPTLVCTNGRMNLADRVLLDELVLAGAEVRYGGDFDPDGLGIADAVLRRYPGRSSLWRMGAEDYRAAVGSQQAPARIGELSALAAIPGALREEVEADGRVGFQESLLEHLWADLMAFSDRLRSGPATPST